MNVLPEYIGSLSISKTKNNLPLSQTHTTNACTYTHTKTRTLLADPCVYTMEDVLSEKECKHFIALADGNLKRATVSDNLKGIHSNGRTGSNYWINHDKDETTKRVGERIAKIVGIPLVNAEAYQLVYYDVNQEYRQHYDCFEHDYSEKTLRCLKYGGQRMATALCYLNDVEEGGGTRLTKANIDIKSKRGKLLVFWNVQKNTNNRHLLSEHAGMPVIKGYKYAFNLWFRECPRTMLYETYNPSYYKKTHIHEPLNIHETLNINKTQSNIDVLDMRNGIFKLSNFIDKDEIDIIHSKSHFDLSKERPSCWVKKEFVPKLISKLNNLFKINTNNFENLNVLTYHSKTIHREHYDAYDINTESGKRFTSKLGQRVYTITGIISNNIEIGFSRIGLNARVNQGDIVFYKNVLEDGITRNSNLIKSVLNKEDNSCILVNIYIRQPYNLKPICENKTEDYMETYNKVLELFDNKQISPNWYEYNSFKISRNGIPSDFLNNYVQKLILKKKHYQGEVLNPVNFNNEYMFTEYEPVIINNVFKEPIIDIFKTYYSEAIQNKYFILGDNQSNRYKANNEAFSRFLHYEILPLIEKIIGCKLQPTYSYLSAYVKDSELPPHTDRPDCEYTVSFIVDKPDNSNWPIYFHKVKQPVKGKGRYSYKPDKLECIECDCGANGLMIFNGRDHIHYREKLEAEFYNILLLHYKI